MNNYLQRIILILSLAFVISVFTVLLRTTIIKATHPTNHTHNTVNEIYKCNIETGIK